MTRHQQVLNLLAIAFMDKSPFPLNIDNKIFISGGWRPVYYFVGKGKGGSAGYQRLWELQTKFGLPVEQKVHKWKCWNGKNLLNNHTPIYRLDIDNLHETNIMDGIEAEKFFKWKFMIHRFTEQIDMGLDV